MGVDYDGVGGLGIEFTEEMQNKLIEQGKLKEDWHRDYDESLSDLNIANFEVAGDFYSGNYRYYFVISKCNNLQDAIDGFPKFKEDIKRGLDIDIEYKDVKVIEDMKIW